MALNTIIKWNVLHRLSADTEAQMAGHDGHADVLVYDSYWPAKLGVLGQTLWCRAV